MENDSEKVVNDFCQAWKRLDLEELMGFFTEDALYHNVPMTPAKGKQGIRDAINSFLRKSKSIEFQILNTVSNGSLVMNERIDKFQLGNGKQVALPVAGVFEIKEGKIARWTDYFDLTMFTKQAS